MDWQAASRLGLVHAIDITEAADDRIYSGRLREAGFGAIADRCKRLAARQFLINVGAARARARLPSRTLLSLDASRRSIGDGRLAFSTGAWLLDQVLHQFAFALPGSGGDLG